MNVKRILVWGVVEGLAVLGLTQCLVACRERAEEPAPRIVNIINFVRQTEPRPVNISDEDLFLTTLRQVELLEKHRLRGTFLLQYDALLNPRYQELMRRALKEGSEVGGWWEITQPHVEAAGMTWRGAYPWDWHANVGFSTGYTPEEREKLVDVYMAEFKKIFGAYPTAVGSWFIDAHTLQYMADRYRIVASCNCRDQVGTDGYTLWGGYWNQAYYPSRKNAYMPAQTPQEQIGVPVFRMLGSDPINQYDSGLGLPAQGVETLEPAYTEGGGNPVWIDWFFDMLTDGPCLGFPVCAGRTGEFVYLASDAARTGIPGRSGGFAVSGGSPDRTDVVRIGAMVQGAFRGDSGDLHRGDEGQQAGRPQNGVVRQPFLPGQCRVGG